MNMMNTYNNNEMMTTNAEGKIFNPVTKRHIKNNVINRNSIKSQIEKHNLKSLTSLTLYQMMKNLN